jgi:MurNAc alpha-1-phosphate uridylyltransferase
MRHDPQSLMVFAAGFGTRMGALTAERPKPLIPVAGRALIDHALALAEGQGLRIAVNAHYRADQVAAHLAGRDVTVLTEATEILDTGGGLKAALPRLGDGQVATLNPDVAWSGPNPLLHLLATPWPEDAGAILLLIPEDRALGRSGPGDFGLGEDGRLSRKGAFVYTGTQIIDAAAVRATPGEVFSLNATWTALAAERRLYGTVYPGRWCDAGSPEGLRAADALLRETA